VLTSSINASLSITKCALWEENFWIVEAKKPRSDRKRESFEYAVFAQALEYAVHPKTNAALIILCDGDLFEVLDREEDVANPICDSGRSELLDNIDNPCSLRSPWQVWFLRSGASFG